MKRILLTIFAVFYLGVSSGATLHFHYCMGELVSWGLHKHTKDICEFCGMPKKAAHGKTKKSCCQDEQQQAKVDKSQKADTTIYQFNAPSSAILQPVPFADYQVQVPVKINREALSNAPPYGRAVPVFLKNCTYRI